MSGPYKISLPFYSALVLAALYGQQVFADETGRDLSGVIGIGLSSAPEFSGSDEDETSIIPIIDLTWRDRYFLNERGLGFYALRNSGPQNLSLGFSVGYDFNERLAEDDARLTGLRDVEAGAFISAHMEFQVGVAAVELEINHGISSDGHEGTRAIVGAEFGRTLGERLQLSAKPFLVWSDSSYASAFYGVSGQEAAASSFTAYDAGSGFERVGIELQASYSLTSRTGLFVSVEHSQLLGDAKDSPISFDNAQTGISTGVFFRF
ncbi:MipA/OmpV family protein [uncultured Tateyamaria sp.]|uniref:MipA/OmpV family protein n=1 Tax=uncultured Tateyamaria sp. TaxID=455651 RepID=UPI0026119444|nr:MipA/OmpV family protein [uncultured Tateyamaria sp.]